MTISLDHWQLLSLIGFILATIVGAGRVLLSQVERRLDLRFSSMEASRQAATEVWRANFEGLENITRENERRLTQLAIDLPMHYQRREDAVRQEVAIIHRLDALSVKVDAALRCDLRACPLRDSHPTGGHP